MYYKSSADYYKVKDYNVSILNKNVHQKIKIQHHLLIIFLNKIMIKLNISWSIIKLYVLHLEILIAKNSLTQAKPNFDFKN